MKTILSGMQPSGQLHIGNYLGALKNWAALQNSGKYMCWFMIADLHAMTVNYDARAIGERTKNLALDYLACGIEAHAPIQRKNRLRRGNGNEYWTFYISDLNGGGHLNL